MATRRLLLRYLPLELADDIIDRANYHPGLLYTYPRSLDATIWGPRVTQNNEVWCFLITPPIPACEKVGRESATNEMTALRADENESLQVYTVRKVKRVTFWINSRIPYGLGSQLEGKLPSSSVPLSLDLTET